MIVYAHAHGFSCPINRLNGSVFCFAVVFPRYTRCDEVNKQLCSTMASSVTLEVFNPDVESVDDYKEHLDFYCTENQVSREQKKALFLTRIEWDAFVKLKTLASPTSLSELSLEQILSTMKQHYKRETVEIAERFKFFKPVQQDTEGVAEYIAELRKLGKTCNFGEYLDTALLNQLVCGLKDHKTQKELLCIQDLTLAMAIEKARAAEAVDREILHFPAMEAHLRSVCWQIDSKSLLSSNYRNIRNSPDQHIPCMPLLMTAVKRRRSLTLTSYTYTRHQGAIQIR